MRARAITVCPGSPSCGWGERMNCADQIRRFATLGNHLPRHCGIATFTTHLTDALVEQLPRAEGFVVAMNDAGRHHAYSFSSPIRNRGSGLELVSPRGRFSQYQPGGRAVRLARVLNLRRPRPVRTSSSCCGPFACPSSRRCTRSCPNRTRLSAQYSRSWLACRSG